jgi:hypothetical protein
MRLRGSQSQFGPFGEEISLRPLTGIRRIWYLVVFSCPCRYSDSLRVGGHRQEVFSSPKLSRTVCGPPSLLFGRFCSSFPGGNSAQSVRLTTDFQLFPRLRMNGALHLVPTYAFMAWIGNFTLCLLCHFENHMENNFFILQLIFLLLFPSYISISFIYLYVSSLSTSFLIHVWLPRRL